MMYLKNRPGTKLCYWQHPMYRDLYGVHHLIYHHDQDFWIKTQTFANIPTQKANSCNSHFECNQHFKDRSSPKVLVA